MAAAVANPCSRAAARRRNGGLTPSVIAASAGTKSCNGTGTYRRDGYDRKGHTTTYRTPDGGTYTINYPATRIGETVVCYREQDSNSWNVAVRLFHDRYPGYAVPAISHFFKGFYDQRVDAAIAAGTDINAAIAAALDDFAAAYPGASQYSGATPEAIVARRQKARATAAQRRLNCAGNRIRFQGGGGRGAVVNGPRLSPTRAAATRVAPRGSVPPAAPAYNVGGI